MKNFFATRFSNPASFTMYSLLKLVLLACCVIAAAAECSVTKYNQGLRDWLKCSNSSIAEAKSKLQQSLVSVSISLSVIPEIPDMAFAQNATTIEDLNFHDCGISRIGSKAFTGLASLKKLSLAYNNLTKLNSSSFYDLMSLEQLDLSFNKIYEIDSRLYLQLQKLQRFDLNDNALREIPLDKLEYMKKLKIMRIQENPLTYLNRARLTLWLKHHKVSWETNDDNSIWSDGVLWTCLSSMSTEPDLDKMMNVCVISSMYDQLTSLLVVSPTKEDSTAQCDGFRRSLTQCLKTEHVKTNGAMLTNLLALISDVTGIGA